LTDTMRHMGFSEKMSEENDILVTGERKPEGSKIMEQKVYKIMRGAGATNIAIGVVTLVVGIVSGILLIVTGGKLIAGKSKILF
jgi:uncharacterized membrane protein YkgB